MPLLRTQALKMVQGTVPFVHPHTQGTNELNVFGVTLQGESLILLQVEYGGVCGLGSGLLGLANSLVKLLILSLLQHIFFTNVNLMYCIQGAQDTSLTYRVVCA